MGSNLLNPCPFCASKAAALLTDTEGFSYVECLECGSRGEVVTPQSQPGAALVAWNRRKLVGELLVPTKLLDALETADLNMQAARTIDKGVEAASQFGEALRALY